MALQMWTLTVLVARRTMERMEAAAKQEAGEENPLKLVVQAEMSMTLVIGHATSVLMQIRSLQPHAKCVTIGEPDSLS